MISVKYRHTNFNFGHPIKLVRHYAFSSLGTPDTPSCNPFLTNTLLRLSTHFSVVYYKRKYIVSVSIRMLNKKFAAAWAACLRVTSSASQNERRRLAGAIERGTIIARGFPSPRATSCGTSLSTGWRNALFMRHFYHLVCSLKMNWNPSAEVTQITMWP